MNNDVYNKSGSSLQDAYARLNEAIKQRNASINGQQYDTTNGVALNTTPVGINNNQAQAQQSNDTGFIGRTIGTIDEANRNFAQAFLKLGEGGVDAAIGLVGLFAPEWAENVIKYDVTNAIMDWQSNNLSVNALYKNNTGKNLYDQSWLNDANEKVRNTIIGVEQGIGSAVGMGLLSSIPVVGPAVAGTSAGGASLEEALNNENYTGNYYGAFGYGVLSGGIEAGVEMLSAGVGKALSGVAKKTGIKWLESGAGIVFGDYKGKNMGAKLMTAISQAVSEGGEEVISEFANPLISTLYTGDSVEESWKKNFSSEQVENAFVVGMLSSLIMGGATNTMQSISENYMYGKDAQGNKNADTMREAYEVTQQMYELKNDQRSYTKDEYNAKMSEYVTKLNELYDSLNSTTNQRQLGNITNQFVDTQTDITTQPLKQAGLKLTKDQIKQIRQNVIDNGLVVDGKLNKEVISDLAKELSFNENTLESVNSMANAIKSNNKGKNIKIKFVQR